jgi:autotransporter-associated beta strand protein
LRLEELESRRLLAAYYVAPNGLDTNPGTLAEPFQTVQRAASVVAPGDIAYLREGVYRETVVPTRSGTAAAPIIFRPYNGESVTISGADVLPAASWTSHSGSIYKAPMSWNLGDGKNQVFVDGAMMNEARWPNTSLDVSRPTMALAASGSTSGSGAASVGTITNSSLNQADDFWNGAVISIARGPEWVQFGETVTDSGPGWLSFSFNATTNWYQPTAGNEFFLTGKFQTLDTATEWFRDSTGTLYLWAPASDNPAGHLVEAKRRQFAFDLSNRSYIHLEGIQIVAATVNSNANSHHLVLDGLNASHVSHYTYQRYTSHWTSAGVESSGIMLRGSDNELRNSRIAYSAGNGVLLLGARHKVFNNTIHDVNYAATDAAAIHTGNRYGTSTDHEISYNTLTNAGRSLIVHRSLRRGNIHHNDMSYAGLQVNDLGATYCFGDDGQGTVIAYNRIHDIYTRAHPVGIYLDEGSSNYVVHHNVVWNVGVALRLNGPAVNHQVYNNTLLGQDGSLAHGFPAGGMSGTQVKNNIFTKSAIFGTGAVQQNNLFSTTNPKFVNPTANDYRLQSSSPAIDAGQILAPYTDGFAGTRPDIGAHEYGRPQWKAGAGHGLSATYSSGSLSVSRIDPTVDFNWAAGPPAPGLASNSFQAVWQGQVEPTSSETYTFRVNAEGGVRLRVNGQLLIDRLTNVGPGEWTGTISLRADQKASVVLEYQKGTGNGSIRMSWSSPSRPLEVVPFDRLHTPPAVLYWDPNGPATGIGGTGTWDITKAQWTTDITGRTGHVPWNNDHADRVVFAGTAGTVTLGTGISVNGLKFETGGYALTGNTLTLAGFAPTIATAGGAITINSAIAGNTGLTVTASTGSDVAFGGANTFSGGLTIGNRVRYKMTHAGALGSTTNTVTVAGGGQLYAAVGGTISNPLRLSGNGWQESVYPTGLGALRLAGGNVTGTITLAGNTRIGTHTGSSGTISGPINGPFNLEKFGPGTLVLSGNNSYTGATTVSGGTLQLTSAGAISGTSQVTVNTADVDDPILALVGGSTFNKPLTLNANSTGDLRTSLQSISGANIWSGPITLDGSGFTQFIAAGGNLTISGAVSGPSFTGKMVVRGTGTGTLSGVVNLPAGGFVKTDSGTWNVNSTANNWTQTSVATGTLRLGVDDALATNAAVEMGQGNSSPFALLDLNGKSQLVGGIDVNDASPIATQHVITSATAATLTVNNSTAYSYEGKLTGALALVKQGTGTLSLRSANTFTGAVNIAAGGLRITKSNALGSGTKSVSVNNGTAGRSQLFLDGSTGAINLPSTISFNTSNQLDQTVVNEAGDNVINGAINLTTGGGNTRIAVNGGSLRLAGTIVPTASGRSLVLEGTGAGTVTGRIADGSGFALALRKDGTGTWTLTGANTYTGTTTVNAGSLLVNGNQSAATGAVTVTSGASLGGIGTIGGNITVATGGVLAPGGSPGSSIGTLTVNGNIDLKGTYRANLNGTNSDRLVVNGNLKLNSATLRIEALTLPGQPLYVLATYGTLTGSFASVVGLPAGYVVDTAYNGNQIAIKRV